MNLTFPGPIETPRIPREVAEYLNRIFPERSPDPKDSEREVWMKAGERRVVIHLLTKLQAQEQDTP